MFIDFYIFNSGGHFIHWSGTVWAILVEGLLGNICVKIILDFGPAVQEELLFKDISIFVSVGHFVWLSKTIWAISVEGFLRNICEIILNLGQQFRRCCLKNIFIYSSGGNFGRGHYGKYSCNIILNSDQWFRRRCCLK